MADQVQLVIDTAKAEANVRRLTNQIAQAKQQLLAAQTVGNTPLVTSTAQQIAAMNQQLAASQRILGQGRSGFQSFGYSIMFAAQAVEDLQYGFSAIVNNIPMIAMSMGAGPGLAGAISLVAVGLNVVTQHWDVFSKALGMSAGPIDQSRLAVSRLREEVKKLDEQQARSQYDQGQLDRARQGLRDAETGRQEYEAMGRARSGIEQESGSTIGSILSNKTAPGGEAGIRDAVTGQISAANIASDPQINRLKAMQAGAEQELAAGNLGADQPVVQKTLRETKEKLDQTINAVMEGAKDEAGALFDAAKKGDAAAQAKLASFLAAAGKGDTAKLIQGASPEAIKRQRAVSDAIEQGSRDAARQQAEIDRENQGSMASAQGAAGAQRSGFQRGFSNVARVSGAQAATDQTRREVESQFRGQLEKAHVPKETIDHFIEDFTRSIADDYTEAIKRIAAERGTTMADAEGIYYLQLKDAMERAGGSAERIAQAKSHRDRAEQKTEGLVEGSNLDPLVQYQEQLRLSKRLGGAGLGQQAAREKAQGKAFDYAKKSKFLGGLGLSDQEAGAYAEQAAAKSSAMAQTGLEQQFAGNPQNAQEMRQLMKAQIEAYRESLRKGFPMIMQ